MQRCGQEPRRQGKSFEVARTQGLQHELAKTQALKRERERDIKS